MTPEKTTEKSPEKSPEKSADRSLGKFSDAGDDPRTTIVPGRRATRQRAAVAELLDQLDDFRSAQELHDELRKQGHGIGLTTVYRTLQSLADADEIDVLRTDTGESIYRRCSRHHHHHLVCRKCGFTVEVEGPAVERWADRVAGENGFTGISHTVELFGTCASCSK